MTKMNNTLQRLLIAAAIALPLSVSAAESPTPAAAGAAAPADCAAPPPQWGPGMQHEGHGEGPGHGGPGGEGPHFGHGPEHGAGFGHGPFGGPGEGEPPFMHGLKLSDAQKDKLFAIRYADLPAVRDQQKIIEKSHEALHDMTRSGKYDDAKATALVQAATQAMAKVMLLQLRAEQQMLAVLTPEQRKEVDERRAHMGGPGKDGKDGKGRPPRPQ